MRKKMMCAVLMLFLGVAFAGNGWSEKIEVKGVFDRYPHTIMKPDLNTLQKWIEAHRNAPQFSVDQRQMRTSSFMTSVDLLSHLQYTPSQRDQGQCGNCWLWAGIGVMEIAHSVQDGVKDRLSIQHVNSCYTNDGDYACCGGWLEDVATIYSSAGIAIPWSNSSASFQDASRTCDDGSSLISCGSISTNPSYSFTSISNVSISTYQVGQSNVIANIKSVLNQNKAVWFGFFLSNNSDWNVFFDHWDYQSESDVFNFDYSNGHDWSDDEGGGHAVLIVGYDDSGVNPYWVALNSWGTTASRPNGLFRIAMNMNYDNYCMYLGAPDQNLFFETLDVEFAAGVPLCPTETLYGEYSEEAVLLRSLRDTVLSQTPEGREIIKLYYDLSPAVVQVMEKDKEFKEQVKAMIGSVLQLLVK